MRSSSVLLPISDALRSTDQPSEHPICFRVEAVLIGELDDLAVQRTDIGASANVKIVQHRRSMTNRRRDQLLGKTFAVFGPAREWQGGIERATHSHSSPHLS